jgi:hypothetical protein
MGRETGFDPNETINIPPEANVEINDDYLKQAGEQTVIVGSDNEILNAQVRGAVAQKERNRIVAEKPQKEAALSRARAEAGKVDLMEFDQMKRIYVAPGESAGNSTKNEQLNKEFPITNESPSVREARKKTDKGLFGRLFS